MINTINTSLTHLSAHHIGSKTNGEDLIASKSPLDVSDDELRSNLLPFQAERQTPNF